MIQISLQTLYTFISGLHSLFICPAVQLIEYRVHLNIILKCPDISSVVQLWLTIWYKQLVHEMASH